MMNAEKRSFYEKAARRLAASARLYGVDAVVHVEDKVDIWFWQQLLQRYRTGRYRFLPATMNERGNRSTGCTQCLKYRGFLSSRFFVCIDSDLRYLAGEEVSAKEGILQTYTYSWENHCTFAPKLQECFDRLMQGRRTFDFQIFLKRYSRIVYKPFLLMLSEERKNRKGFRQDRFRKCISIQFRQGDEANNGAPFLKRIAYSLDSALKKGDGWADFDFEAEAARYAALGLRADNAYLYVRGHCIYNSLVSMGRRLCSQTGVNFEKDILKSALAFGQYEEIKRIADDMAILS